MSTITHRRGRLRRPLAGLVSATLAASALALLPSGAQAAADPTVAPTLTWKISQQFVDHLSTRSLSGDVTFDANKGFTFTGGVGFADSGNGASSIAYTGSVKGAFVNGTTEFYSVTVADPVVTVDSDGEGTISAVVSSANAALGPTQAASTSPTRVVVTTFDADVSDWTTSNGLRSFTDTPDWAGVLPPDSQRATDLGIGAGKPLEGKSFAPTFLDGIVPGVRAHFYASGASSDTKKSPATFTATVGAPATKVTTTSATPAGGLTLSIAGTGFTRSTKPGDAGVYVGLAPSGGLPDTSSFDTSAFAGASWVMPGSIDATTGSFTSTLTAPADTLDPTKTYSLYTWRAHSHSTPSQDTETPVAIDFSALGHKIASTPSLTVVPGTYGRPTTATVGVTGAGTTPGGTVTLTGAGSMRSTLVNGSASFSLPATLGAGRTTLTATYSGDATHAASSTTGTVTVAKAGVRVTRNKIARKPTTRKTGRTSVTVRPTASGVVTGKVTVTFTKKGQKSKAKTVNVRNNKAAVTIPRLAKGTWRISVRYAGSANYASSATKSAGTVRVTKK